MDTTRYSRQIKLAEVGPQGQQRLADARVLVVGVGGLGCPASQYLVAAGVGTVGLLDADVVDISNLHRQVLYTEADLGQPKATTAATALRRMNSTVQIQPFTESLNEKNALELFRAYDIIVDGTDNFPAKYLINDASILTGKPWVYASIYKHQGQVSVFNYRNGPSYRCLFPQPASGPISCEETGVLGVLPGILGCMQAAEVLKMILGIGEVLSGKLKMLDVLGMEVQSIRFEKNENAINQVLQNGLLPETLICTLPDSKQIYLDIRELSEAPRVKGANVICIPGSELVNRVSEIPRNQEIFVFCQSGIRSTRAIHLLREQWGFSNLKNVDGGIQSLIK